MFIHTQNPSQCIHWHALPPSTQCPVPSLTHLSNAAPSPRPSTHHPLFLSIAPSCFWRTVVRGNSGGSYCSFLLLCHSACHNRSLCTWENQRGGNPASKCMWPQRAKPLHTPTTLKVAHTQTYSLSFPRAQWPHAREAFLPAVKTKETGDRQGTWGRCFKATGSASVVSSCGGCWSVEGQLPVFSQPGTNKDECVVCVCHIIGKISEHAALQLLSALYDLRSLPSYTLVCRNKRDNTCTDTHTPSSSSSFLWSVKFWLKAESR